MGSVEIHDEVVAWLAGLDDTQRDRAVVIIDRLAGLGATARMPLSRSLDDGLFELRFTLGSTAQRISRARRAAEDCARTYP